MSTTTITMATAPVTEAVYIPVILHVPPAAHGCVEEEALSLMSRVTVDAQPAQSNYQ